MPIALNLAGQKFGKLTAISPVRRGGKRYWICICECGEEREIITDGLTRGHSKSCGQCIRFGNTRALKHGFRPKSGATPTYNSWESMKKRIASKEGYALVGMDPRWESFSEFLADMGERPKGMTIDRINNEIGYWKDNCRWANKTTQSRNRRIAVTAGIDGDHIPVAEWARREGISYGAAYKRLRKAGLLEGGYNVR